MFDTKRFFLKPLIHQIKVFTDFQAMHCIHRLFLIKFFRCLEELSFKDLFVKLKERERENMVYKLEYFHINTRHKAHARIMVLRTCSVMNIDTRLCRSCRLISSWERSCAIISNIPSTTRFRMLWSAMTCRRKFVMPISLWKWKHWEEERK